MEDKSSDNWISFYLSFDLLLSLSISGTVIYGKQHFTAKSLRILTQEFRPILNCQNKNKVL